LLRSKSIMCNKLKTIEFNQNKISQLSKNKNVKIFRFSALLQGDQPHSWGWRGGRGDGGVGPHSQTLQFV
jgi:hypothetical protein